MNHLDSSFGIHHELVDEVVVRFFVFCTHDRHFDILHYAIATGYPEGRSVIDKTRKSIFRSTHLASICFRTVFTRVGKHEHRKTSITILVISCRQIDCSREVNAIGTLVFDLLLCHAFKHRIWIGKARNLLIVLLADSIKVEVGCLGRRFSRGDELWNLGIGMNAHYIFIVWSFALPENLLFLC